MKHARSEQNSKETTNFRTPVAVTMHNVISQRLWYGFYWFSSLGEGLSAMSFQVVAEEHTYWRHWRYRLILERDEA